MTFAIKNSLTSGSELKVTGIVTEVSKGCKIESVYNGGNISIDYTATVTGNIYASGICYANRNGFSSSEINKFDPFQKLGNWVKTYSFDKLNDNDTLTMKHLSYDGIIFTDNDSSDFSAEKFPKIYIVNDITLCKNLGKYGLNIGNVEIWKHWYKIVK